MLVTPLVTASPDFLRPPDSFEHNVGVTQVITCSVKRIYADFFEEG